MRADSRGRLSLQDYANILHGRNVGRGCGRTVRDACPYKVGVNIVHGRNVGRGCGRTVGEACPYRIVRTFCTDGVLVADVDGRCSPITRYKICAIHSGYAQKARTRCKNAATGAFFCIKAGYGAAPGQTWEKGRRVARQKRSCSHTLLPAAYGKRRGHKPPAPTR